MKAATGLQHSKRPFRSFLVSKLETEAAVAAAAAYRRRASRRRGMLRQARKASSVSAPGLRGFSLTAGPCLGSDDLGKALPFLQCLDPQRTHTECRGALLQHPHRHWARVVRVHVGTDLSAPAPQHYTPRLCTHNTGPCLRHAFRPSRPAAPSVKNQRCYHSSVHAYRISQQNATALQLSHALLALARSFKKRPKMSAKRLQTSVGQSSGSCSCIWK